MIQNVYTHADMTVKYPQIKNTILDLWITNKLIKVIASSLDFDEGGLGFYFGLFSSVILCPIAMSYASCVAHGADVCLLTGTTGNYYCGMKVLTCQCCDGSCGPNNGCNCPPCQQLDREEAGLGTQDDQWEPPPSQPIIDSWTWGPQPGRQGIAIAKCIKAVSG